MDIQNDDSCILCGKNNQHGLKLEFTLDYENNKAYTFVNVGKIFNGFTGIVHGGIICALLDEAGFYACRTLDIITVTMSLNTKFKKPVPINTKLYLEGEVVQRRSRSVITNSKLMLASVGGVSVNGVSVDGGSIDGEVLASATGEFFIKK